MGDHLVGRFKKHFPLHVYQNIAACLKERQGIGATILICCAIDTLSKYASAGSATSGNKLRYTRFLKDHFPAEYKPLEFYEFVRCGLLHSFDMDKKFVILSSKEPWAQNLHLLEAPNGKRLIINPFKLFRHLKRAHKSFCLSLETEPDVRAEFVKVYKRSPMREQHLNRKQILKTLGIRKKELKSEGGDLVKRKYDAKKSENSAP